MIVGNCDKVKETETEYMQHKHNIENTIESFTSLQESESDSFDYDDDADNSNSNISC